MSIPSTIEKRNLLVASPLGTGFKSHTHGRIARLHVVEFVKDC
jgi:hypothetical protein